MEVVHHTIRTRGKVLRRHNQPRVGGRVSTSTPDLSLQPRFSGIAEGDIASAVLSLDALVYRPRVVVGGVAVSAAQLVGPVLVEIQRRGLHSWSFGVRIESDGTSVLGRSATSDCGLLGGQSVDIGVEVLTAAGWRDRPLIVGGVEHQADEDRETATITVSGTGASGLYDQAETGLLLDSGSLLPRGTVVHRALIEAGIPSSVIQISGGVKITKGVDAAGEQVFSLADDLLLPAVEAIHSDPCTGKITTAPLGKLSASPRWIIGTGGLRILSGTASITGSDASQGPTKITVKSTKQLTDPDCGEETTRTVITTENTFAVPTYESRYDASGAVVAGTVTFGARFQRSAESITTVVRRCGEEVSRIEEEWAWYEGPEVWKAKLATDGTVDSVNTNGYHYGPAASTTIGGSEIDPTPMRAWQSARWTLIQRRSESRVFATAADTTVGPQGSLLDIAGGEAGLLVNIRRRLEGWHHIETALKTRSVSSTTPWDEVVYINLVKVLANGSGSLYGEERFGRFVNEDFDSSGSPITVFGGVDAENEIVFSDGGSTVKTEIEHRSWAAWPGNPGGSLYWYASGDVSNVQDWRFEHHETVTTNLTASGESSHDATVSTNTHETARSSNPLNRESQRGLSGGLPGTPKILGEPGGERVVAAPPDQVQEIEHTVDLRVDACRHPRTETVEVFYAEGEIEIRSVAAYLAADSLSKTWSGSTRINPDLTVTEQVTVSDAPFFTGVVHPETIRHEMPPEGLPTSIITGRIYA